MVAFCRLEEIDVSNSVARTWARVRHAVSCTSARPSLCWYPKQKNPTKMCVVSQAIALNVLAFGLILRPTVTAAGEPALPRV
jgi:hypothetical protein